LGVRGHEIPLEEDKTMEAKGNKLYKSNTSNPVNAGESSKLKYFYIEKKRQELHKLLNFYGGSVNHLLISQKETKP
jgi:hypothetical protein